MGTLECSVWQPFLEGCNSLHPHAPETSPGGGQSGEFLLPFSEIDPLLPRATESTGGASVPLGFPPPPSHLQEEHYGEPG